MRGLCIVDCTLREGDQAPGVWLSRDDKIAIFKALDDAGIQVVDAGMPIVSEEERDLLRTLSRMELRGAQVAASVRSFSEEIRMAADLGVDEVFIIYPVSAIHRRERLRITDERWHNMGLEVLRTAREVGVVANLVLEDASRTDPADLHAALDVALEGQADTVMLCDTVGVLTPSKAAALVRSVKAHVGDRIVLGTHFHDDLGMATANTVAAVEAGAIYPSVTVNGVGERAGNAVLAELVAACEMALDRPTGVWLQSMPALSQLVEARTGVPLSDDAPLVGATTFDHESGIHVHGVLRAPHTYESVAPELLGRRRRLVLGKHSGRAGLAVFAAENALPAEGPVFDRVLQRLKAERPGEYQQGADAHLAVRDAYIAERLRRAEARVRQLFDEEGTP